MNYCPVAGSPNNQVAQGNVDIDEVNRKESTNSTATQSDLQSLGFTKVAFIKGAPNCSTACTVDFASGECLEPPLQGEAQDLMQKFNNLRQYVISQNSGIIFKSSVMSIFGIDKDACDRKDTVIKDGTISNAGDSGCDLSANLPVPGVDHPGVTLSLPPIVKGAIAIKDPLISIEFSDATVSPALTFDDQGLDHDWGGSVRTISGDTTRVLFGTDKGCIMLSNQ
jgi:hypothetical protein